MWWGLRGGAGDAADEHGMGAGWRAGEEERERSRIRSVASRGKRARFPAGVRGPGGAGHNAGVQEPGIRTVVPRSVRGPLASKDPACVRLVRFTTCSAESFHVKIDL